MILVEKNNESNIQTFVKPENSEDSISKSILIKNLIHRLIKEIDSSKETYESISPKLSIRISRLNPSGLLTGTLNIKPKSGSLDNPLVSNLFKDSNVELPSDRVLSSRLEEFHYSEDPLRMKNVEYKTEEILNFSDITFSSLLNISDEFEDEIRFYSDIESSQIRNPLSAEFIISLDKVLKSNPKHVFSSEDIDFLIKEVPEKDTEEVKSNLLFYINNPNKRGLLVKDALKVQANNDPVRGGKSIWSNIPTWKIALTCGVVVLGALAYANRDVIKGAYKLAKEDPNANNSKVLRTFKLLSSSKGRSNARSFSKNKSFLNYAKYRGKELEVEKQELNAQKSRADLNISKILGDTYGS